MVASLLQEDDLSLAPNTHALREPPPSYEDVTQGDIQEEQKQR